MSSSSSSSPTIIDLMPKFKIQEEVYKKEKTLDGKQWPYRKPTEQYHYEEWLAQVKDPVTGEFYKSKDTPTPKEMKHVIHSIYRVRSSEDGSEKLYSMGTFIGYNSFGDEVRTKAYKPEVAEKTNFNHKTSLGKNNRLIKETTGPAGVTLEYMTPFTPENLEKLYNLKKDNKINFYVQEEETKKTILVKNNNNNNNNNTIQQTFELFRDSSFDSLFYAQYRTPSSTRTKLNEPEKIK